MTQQAKEISTQLAEATRPRGLNLDLFQLPEGLRTLEAYHQDTTQELADLEAAQAALPDHLKLDPDHSRIPAIGEIKETIAAVEQEITKYLIAQIERVNDIAGFYKWVSVQADYCDGEIERLEAVRSRFRRLQDILKEGCRQALIVADKKSINGTNGHKIWRQANGQPSVEFVDPAAVPDRFVEVTLKTTLDYWNEIKGIEVARGILIGGLVRQSGVNEFRRSLIAEAITNQPCPKCSGTGEIERKMDISEIPASAINDGCIEGVETRTCSGCGGRGHMIPGVKLVKGEHCRIK